jgi:hypothetical protein
VQRASSGGSGAASNGTKVRRRPRIDIFKRKACAFLCPIVVRRGKTLIFRRKIETIRSHIAIRCNEAALLPPEDAHATSSTTVASTEDARRTFPCDNLPAEAMLPPSRQEHRSADHAVLSVATRASVSGSCGASVATRASVSGSCGASVVETFSYARRPMASSAWPVSSERRHACHRRTRSSLDGRTEAPEVRRTPHAAHTAASAGRTTSDDATMFSAWLRSGSRAQWPDLKRPVLCFGTDCDKAGTIGRIDSVPRAD